MSSPPPIRIGLATLYLGDCLELLPDLDPVDGIITDPPYSSGGAFRGDRAQSVNSKYLQNSSSNQSLEGFAGDNRDQRGFAFWSTLWMTAALRATKPGGVAVVFTDWRQLPVSTDYLQAGGWVWRGVVPWIKPNARPQMGRYAAAAEFAIWGSHGALPVERGVGCLPGWYTAHPSHDREHVTQKPEKLMRDLVEIVPAGCPLADPFMGSGSTGVAAVASGRPFVGIELNPHHFSTACRRIEDAQRQNVLL